MPTETRRILFSNAELYAALDEHLAKAGSRLPAGAIRRISSDGEFHRVVKVDIRTNKGTGETLELHPEQIGAALISYCMTNQIPLPRGFSKSLVVVGDNVAIQVTNNPGTPLSDDRGDNAE